MAGCITCRKAMIVMLPVLLITGIPLLAVGISRIVKWNAQPSNQKDGFIMTKAVVTNTHPYLWECTYTVEIDASTIIQRQYVDNCGKLREANSGEIPLNTMSDAVLPNIRLTLKDIPKNTKFVNVTSVTIKEIECDIKYKYMIGDGGEYYGLFRSDCITEYSYVTVKFNVETPSESYYVAIGTDNLVSNHPPKAAIAMTAVGSVLLVIIPFIMCCMWMSYSKQNAKAHYAASAAFSRMMVNNNVLTTKSTTDGITRKVPTTTTTDEITRNGGNTQTIRSTVSGVFDTVDAITNNTHTKTQTIHMFQYTINNNPEFQP